MGAGPYVVLPVFGPSTLRDTAALPVDRAGSVLGNMNDVAWRNSLSFVEAVDTRAKYLRAGRLLDDAALDKYTFTRDAFLQHRRNDVYDGNPLTTRAGNKAQKGADRGFSRTDGRFSCLHPVSRLHLRFRNPVGRGPVEHVLSGRRSFHCAFWIFNLRELP